MSAPRDLTVNERVSLALGVAWIVACAVLVGLMLADVVGCAPPAPTVLVVPGSGSSPPTVIELPQRTDTAPAEAASWLAVIFDALKAAAAIAAPIVDIVQGATNR